MEEREKVQKGRRTDEEPDVEGAQGAEARRDDARPSSARK